MANNIKLDIETALEAATVEQLWQELSSRYIDCLLVGDLLNEDGTITYSDLKTVGTVAQLLGLQKYSDILITNSMLNNIQ